MPKRPKKTQGGNKTRYRGHPAPGNAPPALALGGNRIVGDGNVTVDLNGTQVTVPGAAFGDGRFEITEAQAHAFLQNSFNEGRNVYNQITMGMGGSYPPTRERIASLLWYLKLVSERSAGTAFAKGALTLPDPNGLLQSWLNSAREVYLRSSSHLKETVNWLNFASGIDFYTGQRDWDFFLPYGLNTILIQQVSPDGTQRLYLKFEKEGTRFNTFNLNPFAPRPDFAPRDTKAKLKDILRSLLHGLDFLSTANDYGLPAFRENTPREVTSPYMALLDYATRMARQSNDVRWAGIVLALFQGYTPPTDNKEIGESIRIHDVIRNLYAVYNVVGDQDLPTFDPQFAAFLQGLLTTLQTRYDPNLLPQRFGDEVILTNNDFW